MVKGLALAREIKRIMGWRGFDTNEMETEEGEEERTRGSFDNGISVEGEFAFTKAVGNFCREGRGGFKEITNLTSRNRWNKKQRVKWRRVIQER